MMGGGPADVEDAGPKAREEEDCVRLEGRSLKLGRKMLRVFGFNPKAPSDEKIV